MPTCAACKEPLCKDQRVKIVGHEAVHASCVGLPTINQTLAVRINQFAPRIAALEATATAQQGEATRLLLEQRRLQEELERAISARNEALDLASSAVTARDNALAQVTTLTRERDAARDAARVATSRVATPETSPQPDAEDATVIRFGLLEYD